MESIIEIKKQVMDNTIPEDRRVKGIWCVDCLYNPKDNGRIFKYKFIISQTVVGQGCAYSLKANYSIPKLELLIGNDFINANIKDEALLVSLLDSCYQNISDLKPIFSETMNADSETKMRWRTRIIKSEAEKLIGSLKDKKVVNVGVVGDILKSFKDEGANVIGTDFDDLIVGKTMFGTVEIRSGSETLNTIKNSDLCIVTGMTIVTKSIDAIITCCLQSDVKIIIFAETGANLGPYYVTKGVDSYVGETFPFYIFNGISIINVYNKIKLK
jgi:hypothetical protein